ncbi:hypothetical protein Purlil1_13308 [Purpureocillium lilacinum]|uniref:HMA domain-containing protein n=1 Tax=Purpureocillium lilacinum TaxID=33203 RepID=A0ABR0BEE4_PURLI|nr:hypothetical protein Purlil1_13308 [Purpureocillium lilacinum]
MYAQFYPVTASLAIVVSDRPRRQRRDNPVCVYDRALHNSNLPAHPSAQRPTPRDPSPILSPNSQRPGKQVGNRSDHRRPSSTSRFRWTVLSTSRLPSALRTRCIMAKEYSQHSSIEGSGPMPIEAAIDDGTEVANSPLRSGSGRASGRSDESRSRCCSVAYTDDPANGSGDALAATTGCNEHRADARSQESSPDATCPDDKGCGPSCTKSRESATTVYRPDVAECCRTKPSPCCDESCLDHLAVLECADGACIDEADDAHSRDTVTPENRRSTGRKRAACGRHRRSARDRYGATLEALGCICSALIALGRESCCKTLTSPRLERGRCSRRVSVSSLARCSEDFCRPTITTCEPSDGCCDNDRRTRSSTRKSSCQQTTLSPSRGSFDAYTGAKKTSATTHSNYLAAAHGVSVLPADINGSVLANATDLEKQACGSEHAVLCVSGMTCTGCETKLNRSLATLAGVSNLKTSLVLSRAEFDVDLSVITVDEVIKHLERTTEFRSERISNSGSSVEIVVPGEASDFPNKAWPAGVTDIFPLGKHTVRITFDPKLVGARDLVEKHWAGESVALAPVRGDPGLEAGGKHVRHVGYMTLLSACLTIPVLVMAWAPLPEREIAYDSASLALATIVQVVVAGPFYPKALKALIFSRVIEMDLLVVLSTSAAYIFSLVSFGHLVAGKPLATRQFFETSTLLVTLIMVGRFVAAFARQKAVESISIRTLQASTAVLVDGANASNEREIDVRFLQYGDTFKVLPDSRIPTDGTVIAGSSEVDESMLTGESLPVEKQTNSRVIAGTINGSGTLLVRVARLAGDNTITTIAAMVDEAKLSKPKLQELADQVASYFVPVIIALTAITFAIWIAVGIAIRGKSGSTATVDAITYAITVLIVSCPCAIGLAVPMVVVIASGVAAERGVIFKSAGAIEVAYKASHVVFDKTGTLTQGKLAVVSEYCTSEDASALALLLGLISDSRHPVSVAVANHLRSKGVGAAVVSGAKSLTGRGIEAQVDGRTVCAGNSRWLQLSSNAAVESVLAQNHTAFCFTIDGALAAVYGLEDSLRTDAAQVVSALQKRGISVHVVSGDDDGPVQDAAAKLHIPRINTRSRSSPAEKQAYINVLLGEASKAEKATVIFCGDGTNDAVALAQATIGIHMNEGSDVAQSAADVVLMRPNLSGILTVLNMSKRSVNRIRFNFGWSFTYNTFAILLAAGAFVNARIPPEFAGLGELVSVLPVIAAAVLLRWPRS